MPELGATGPSCGYLHLPIHLGLWTTAVYKEQRARHVYSLALSIWKRAWTGSEQVQISEASPWALLSHLCPWLIGTHWVWLQCHHTMPLSSLSFCTSAFSDIKIAVMSTCLLGTLYFTLLIHSADLMASTKKGHEITVA